MLIVDVSSVMHTGMYQKQRIFGGANEDVELKGILYLFRVIATHARESSIVQLVFDPEIGPEYNSHNPEKPSRKLNQRVHWELRVLRKLLDVCGLPYHMKPGYSADDLVYSLVENSKWEMPGKKIFILSADQDLACNICAGDDEHAEVRLLSFSTKSYNLDYNTMEKIIGIPLGRVNEYKTIHGCKSDNIAPLKDSKNLWSIFLEKIGEREFDTYQEFATWASWNLPMSAQQGIKENGAKVFPKYSDDTGYRKFNIGRFSGLAYCLTGSNEFVYQGLSRDKFSEEQQRMIDEVIDSVSQAATPLKKELEDSLSFEDMEMSLVDLEIGG